jgi:ribosomal protein S3AE
MEINVFAYVDDIVVASRKKETQIQDLAETFSNMHRAQLKLNPEKCAFGVSRGKVLGCLVSMKGIEANPDKINATVHKKSSGVQKRGVEANRQNSGTKSVHGKNISSGGQNNKKFLRH